MARNLAALFCLIGGLAFLSLHSSSALFGADEVVGAIWEYKAEKDGEKVSGKFRAYRRELFIDDKKIGSIQPKDDDESHLKLIHMPDEKLNGEATIRKTKKGKNATWVGTLKTKGGENWTLTVVLKDK